MRKIILASASPQRKSLLKNLGIKFIIKPAHAPEISTIKTTCAALAKENALLKAKKVAKTEKDAIIIGADTVVYSRGKKIIGKPKDLPHAKRMLKTICRAPHWVYTGLAVIDTKTKKTILASEGTKVFMTPLTDKEIESYYRDFCPLGKSGGFNIEGKGSLFINRIEGCYFNVIGLPLSKLRLMLKRMGVSALFTALMFSFLGCATEYNLATEKQETTFITPEKEMKIGESMSQEYDKQLKLNTDIEENDRVRKILRRIADVCDRQELVYTIKIIDEDKVNAVSLPGGYIYVYQGLINKAKSDDELAGVIAHEVGHITARHSVKKMESLYGYTLLQILSIQSGNSDVATGAQVAFASVFFAYSREDEFEADRLAVKYCRKAGYDPKGIQSFLRTMKNLSEKEPSYPYSYWRTHPYLSQRIAASNQAITGNVEFKDYLNLMGDK